MEQGQGARARWHAAGQRGLRGEARRRIALLSVRPHRAAAIVLPPLQVREKLANLVLFDQKTLDKLMLEVPKLKLITVSVVSERLKIGASLARAALKELLEKGLIRVISYHSKQAIYTRAPTVEEAKVPKGGEKKAKAAAAMCAFCARAHHSPPPLACLPAPRATMLPLSSLRAQPRPMRRARRSRHRRAPLRSLPQPRPADYSAPLSPPAPRTLEHTSPREEVRTEKWISGAVCKCQQGNSGELNGGRCVALVVSASAPTTTPSSSSIIPLLLLLCKDVVHQYDRRCQRRPAEAVLMLPVREGDGV